MNIINQLKPLLLDRQGVDDSKWWSKATSLNSASGLAARVVFRNEFFVKKSRGVDKYMPFGVVFLIHHNGDITFRNVTMGSGGMAEAHREQAKESLNILFTQPIKKALNK